MRDLSRFYVVLLFLCPSIKNKNDPKKLIKADKGIEKKEQEWFVTII